MKLPSATKAVQDNPESPTSPVQPRKVTKPVVRRGPKFAAMDTSDLQSEDSTSFEVQSTRGASEICLESLPSLAAELIENLPPATPTEASVATS